MALPAWGDTIVSEEESSEAALSRPSALRDWLDRERERFFLWSPVCFAAGISAYFGCPREPNLFYAALPLCFALICRFVTTRGTLAAHCAIAGILAAAGFLASKVRVEIVRAPTLEHRSSNVEVTGTIAHIEPKGLRGARVTIAVSDIAGVAADKRPQFVRIRFLQKASEAKPGDQVRVKATLAPPAKPPLPGGFDYARQAWFERVGGVGYSYSVPDVMPDSGVPNFFEASQQGMESLRLAIDARIKAALPGDKGAIASALISGERGDISASTNEAYRNAGLFHILSISGLHMVVMAGAVFYVIRLGLAAVPSLALRYAIKKWAAVAGIIAACAYLAISGGAFATVRSALMIAVIFGAVLLDRPALALRNVAVSAFFILIAYPESLFDAGFQMSFAAVTGLVASYEEARKRMARRDQPHPVLRVALFFGGIVFSTLIASVAVAPFAAYHFHQSQQYAVIANLAAIPICNLIVMPAALATLVLMPFGLESLALWPMGAGIDAMTWCANAVSRLPGAVGHLPAIPELSFGLMVVGGLWLALWQSRVRFFGVAAVLAGIALAPLKARPDILIARNGELVAIRAEDGRLSALPARQAKFEIEKWLEDDGDARRAKEVQQAQGFRCDGIGCAAKVKDLRLSVAQHPAAIADDCERGDIVVLKVPKPKAGCAAGGTVIDVFDVWQNGTYALYVTPESNGIPPSVVIDTVAAHRGERPWSMPPARRARKPIPRLDDAAPTADLPKFAQRPEMLQLESPRPEIEDDLGTAPDGPEGDGNPGPGNADEIAN